MKLLLTFLGCITFYISYSQKVAITYYDESWMLTTRELASYFRVGRIDTVKYLYYGEVKDYYMTGQLQMKGKYIEGVKTDTFYFYYPNGQLMTQGYYLQNARYGIWTNFYDDSSVKDIIVYNDHFLSVLEYYDKDGKQKLKSGNGEWMTQYYNDFTMDTVKIKGYFVDSLRDGTWEYYHKSTNTALPKQFTRYRLVCKEKFKQAKFINGTYYWGGGGIEPLSRPVYEILPERKKFENIEKWKYSRYASIEAYPYLKFLPHVDSSAFPLDKAATFPGGFKALEKAITHHIKLSTEYICSQKLRTVMVNIMIDELGNLSIVESFDDLLRLYPANRIFHEQVISSVNALPAWEPAIRGGHNAKHFYSLSVLLDNGRLSVLLHSKNLINKE